MRDTRTHAPTHARTHTRTHVRGAIYNLPTGAPAGDKKTSEKEIVFSDFVQFIHDKIKIIRMTYVMNGNLSDFMNMYGFFYT